MGNIKSTFLITVLLGVVACAGMQATEETLNSVELKGHQIYFLKSSKIGNLKMQLVVIEFLVVGKVFNFF